jgi:hypothetical protein
VGRALRGMGPGWEHWRRLRGRDHGTKLPRQRWFPPPGPRQDSASHSETRDHSAICPTFCAAGGRTATVRGAPLTGAGADLNADAIAFATLTYAMDTSSVTGGAAAA